MVAGDRQFGKPRAHLPSRASLLLLLALLMVSAASWFALRGPSSSTPRNVVLISIDTCRADRLSCYGFDAPTTPNIDALAVEGIRFANAISTAPITLPAHSSMMTGRTPPAHGARDNDMQLGEDAVTLAEVLSAQGLKTGAVVAATVLRRAAGLAQGFDSYDDQFSGTMPEQFVTQRHCDEVVDRALRWLSDHRDDPFFLFVHFFDPHGDYAPPQPFATTFAGDPYAGEVAYADACVGRVIQALKALELYDSTAIVVTSDHGEGLGDHGEGTHSYFVYESTLHVPWVMRVPGLEQPQTIDAPVSVIDQMPTILGLLDLSAPPETEGRDLSPVLRGEATADDASHALYGECVHPTVFGCSPLFSVRQGNWKYIHSADPELYDLSADPGEDDNRIAQEHDRAQRMRALLEQLVANAEATPSASQKAHLSPQEVRMLEALGYSVGGGNDFDFDPNEQRESPRSFLADFAEHTKIHGEIGYLTRGEGKHGAGRTHRAKGLLPRARALADRRSRVDQFQYDAAEIALAAGENSLAERYYRRTLALAPERADAALSLSELLALRGNYDVAYEQLAAAARAGADPIRQHVRFATGLAHRGDVDAALRRLRGALSEHPESQPLRAALAVILMRSERYDEALAECNEALREHPRAAATHLLKVDILIAADRSTEAASALATALEVHPGHQVLLARKQQLASINRLH